jgi:hypothetical protein
VVDDVFGITPHTSDQRRAQRVQEEEPDNVETGTRLDDAPIMNRKAIAGGLVPVTLELGGKAPTIVASGTVHDRTVSPSSGGSFAAAGRPASPRTTP